ncbi:helix-turn-helix domain-containing protein [Rhizobium sp. CF142]|uniref:helix-turn-helix domain-containing protein n=1 Tax=Rhizobium sp. CF142 TaxID=1144314 RepID=UPI00026EEC62|nr:AraC family transcriptional regulator [Rhizobium sp. CF142]EJJ25484.1 DNA-binding domain-containing protein, AraC-type [Rhizobium sp. CF142]
MLDIDPRIFSINRPSLQQYKAFVQRDLIIETYHSSSGEMVSQGSLHRISINRTAHRKYAHRYGSAKFRSVDRPSFTLGFQPALINFEVEGDAADYISIFQAPKLYENLGLRDFDPDRLNDDVFSAASDPTTLQVALSLAAAVEQTDCVDPLLMEHLGMALACSVVRLLGAKAPVGIRSITSEKLKRVTEYVEDYLYRADLNVDELAGVAHMSHFHFSRAFKKAVGKPPHQFILDRRIEKARIYLADGKETLSEIAYAIGFSSQAHFSSVFRRMVGVTPANYRKSFQ